MAVMNEVMAEAVHIAARALDARQTSAPTTTTSPVATTSAASSSNNSTTQSPLLFFVALGFGVVFTNLWIIVGVKYCFRYNARNRALARGEEDPMQMENMPRPHRRRREKKLMTMDEVNERFPLMKYKNWAAQRAAEGLPTAGGVTAPPSRAASVRDVAGVIPSSPTDTKHSIEERPATAPAGDAPEITVSPPRAPLDGSSVEDKKSMEKEKQSIVDEHEHMESLEEVNTAVTTDTKGDMSGHEDDDDDEDHIHTALPPELINTPGDQCAICIDTLEGDDDIRGLTCGHAFHASCLDPWLTSRRACCPLCKADYYVPKPRPEGEAAEAERSRRSNQARMNLPQQPRSAWTGIRGNPRMMLPSRFMSSPLYPRDGFTHRSRSRDRRARRAARRAADAQQPAAANPEAPGEAITPAVTSTSTQNSNSFFSRVNTVNPLSRLRPFRYPGQRNQAPANNSTPTPAQLEEGVVR